MAGLHTATRRVPPPPPTAGALDGGDANAVVTELLKACEALGDANLLARAAALGPSKRAGFLKDVVTEWAERAEERAEGLRQRALSAEATSARLEAASATAMADAAAAQSECAFLREQGKRWRDSARDEAASRADAGVVQSDAAGKHAVAVAAALWDHQGP